MCKNDDTAPTTVILSLLEELFYTLSHSGLPHYTLLTAYKITLTSLKLQLSVFNIQGK